MAVTMPGDLKFVPKVWAMHSDAYFEERLVMGTWAVINKTLEGEGKGVVVNFPYYGTIGDAYEVQPDERVRPYGLTDDSFTAAVYEVAISVAIQKAALMHSADSAANFMRQAQMQMGRRHAEKVDQDLMNEVCSYNGAGRKTDIIGTDETKYDNMTIGFKAAAATDTMDIENLYTAKVRAFGDKHRDAVVCFMHPLQVLDLNTSNKTGFLKADANEPYSSIDGFQGKLAGMAIIESERVKKLPVQIGGKDAYLAHFHKMNSYGIIRKEEMMFDSDKDIHARNWSTVGTQWYGVKSFHRQISNDDRKAGGIITTVSQDGLAGRN